MRFKAEKIGIRRRFVKAEKGQGTVPQTPFS